MRKKEAYKIVLEDLETVGLFTGIYDAENGCMDFMYGIGSIMEFIANGAGKTDEFQDMFFNNMEESERKVKDKKSGGDRWATHGTNI